MNRRSFLKGLATTSALSMSYPWCATSWAQQAAPKRLLILSHCHGWTYRSWRMHPTGFNLDQPGSFDLTTLDSSMWSEALAPLYRHRNHCIAIDGLSLATAELDSGGNRHDKGWIHAWSGNHAIFNSADTKATHASIDQHIAGSIARPDRIPSLELGIDSFGETGRPIAYNLAGSRLPIESDPQKVWQRLFGPSQSVDPLHASHGKGLDFAYQEYKQIQANLPQHSRQKLDSHFALVQNLHTRLEGLRSLQCESIPAIPSMSRSYDERFDLMSEFIASAFACDITRVVTLTLGELATSDFGYDHLSDNVHKGLAHGIYDNEEKHQAMSAYLSYHSEQVARLVDLLSSIPDRDGQSVMDNTLIVWGSELADGWHGYQHYCPVLLGGSWAFPTGRYHYMPHDTPIQLRTASGMTDFSGTPHQSMLVSIAQAFGLTDDFIGLKRVQSQSGFSIDCSGPLSILT